MINFTTLVMSLKITIFAKLSIVNYELCCFSWKF